MRTRLSGGVGGARPGISRPPLSRFILGAGEARLQTSVFPSGLNIVTVTQASESAELAARRLRFPWLSEEFGLSKTGVTMVAVRSASPAPAPR